jgi:hypothetical protein
MTETTAEPATINLDADVVVIGDRIMFSRLEVEHWIGGVDAMLLAKTETLRERFITAAKDAIERRGWL